MDKEELKAKRVAALAKAREAKKAKKADESFVQIASADGMSEADLLRKENADLKARLAAAELGRSAEEREALATAQAQSTLLQREIQEVPTGKTVSLPRFKEYKTVGHKDNGDPILKPVFHRVEVPTYFYRIDMPPVGGIDLKLNGTSFYQDAVYELDVDTLRTVKEIVYRLWKHDRDIHGSDENAYRKPQRPQLSARGM